MQEEGAMGSSSCVHGTCEGNRLNSSRKNVGGKTRSFSVSIREMLPSAGGENISLENIHFRLGL
jgi:hypothetical protein